MPEQTRHWYEFRHTRARILHTWLPVKDWQFLTPEEAAKYANLTLAMASVADEKTCQGLALLGVTHSHSVSLIDQPL